MPGRHMVQACAWPVVPLALATLSIALIRLAAKLTNGDITITMFDHIVL